MVEIFELPTGWRWVKLDEVCDSASNRDPRIMPDKPFRYVDISSIDNRSKRIMEARTILGKNAPSRARQVIKTNDIIVATTRPNLNAVAIVGNELNNEICSTGFCVLRPSDNLEPIFLFYYVQTKYFVDIVSGQVRGMLYPAVTDSQIRNTYLPLPPLIEQKRIVARLQEQMQEIERARISCEKQLEAANALPAAYLREVFESKEAKKWMRKRLGEACESDSGIWGDESDGSESCYPVLRSNNIHSGQMIFDEVAIRKINFKHIKDKKLSSGDVLIVTSSGSRNLLGKSALFVQPSDGKTYFFSNFTIRLRPKNELIDAYFLYFYLQSPKVKEILQLLQDTTTGLRNLDRKEFLNQLIPIPPLQIQHRIATELKEKMSQVENLKARILNQQSALESLPQVILRKAFRGEL